MSGLVGVLAVMERLQSSWRDESQIVGRWDSADELAAVLAAVADLIEALAPVEKLDVLRDSGVIGDDELVCLHGSTVNRIRAALARVKGESK